MKFNVFILAVLLLNTVNLFGQDYFEDSKGSGFSVLLDNRPSIFSAKINLSDNSIKADLSHLYVVKKKSDTLTYNIGWGVSLKGKSEDNLGILLTTGNFVPGFNGNGYFAFRKIIKKPTAKWWVCILSGGYSLSKYNLYYPNKIYSKQIIDTVYQGYNLGLSWCYIFPVGKGKTSNLIVGASVGYSMINNYGDLSKVEIKDTRIVNDTGGNTRNITNINSNGSVYGEGKYLVYGTTKFRGNLAYVPSFLSNRISLMIYPSINYSNVFAPMYNVGMGIHYLQKGHPSTSICGIFVEFNDISNAQEKTGGIIKRTLTIGLTASLNISDSSK
jgi:hypothetical protein